MFSIAGICRSPSLSALCVQSVSPLRLLFCPVNKSFDCASSPEIIELFVSKTYFVVFHTRHLWSPPLVAFSAFLCVFLSRCGHLFSPLTVPPSRILHRHRSTSSICLTIRVSPERSANNAGFKPFGTVQTFSSADTQRQKEGRALFSPVQPSTSL